MIIDEIITGKTYRGTMRETRLTKKRGGYYTGYVRKETGRICEVEFRVDQVRHQTVWGSWIEVCGNRRSVSNSFSVEELNSLQFAEAAS
jgi:hypothetical protein